MARKPTKHRPSGTDPGRMSGQGELRIIGGDWRSRKLRFPDAGGVRPTPARTRETLFNWLNFHLAGARCLDLFAGSGVLGLEALSRGADSATLVDHTPALAQGIAGQSPTARRPQCRGGLSGCGRVSGRAPATALRHRLHGPSVSPGLAGTTDSVAGRGAMAPARRVDLLGIRKRTDTAPGTG